MEAETSSSPTSLNKGSDMEPFHAGGVLPKPPQFKIVGSCTIGFIEYSEMGITNRCSCPLGCSLERRMQSGILCRAA